MTKQADAVKIYTRRDSATSVLRKMGIKPRDYDFFIEKMEDGRVACQIARAEMHLESLSKPIKTTKRLLKENNLTAEGALKEPKPKAAKKKDTKVKQPTISGLARQLIIQGKTNKEVMAALVKEFGEERMAGKGHYPTWYRCEVRRRGELPAAFDNHYHNNDHVEVRFE